MENKREFIQDVIEKVREIPISSVVETKVSLVKRAGLHKGLCPFHNDHHIGSFVVSDKKQIFKCFSCGTAGDNIKFIALYENINYVESAMKIALNNGIVSYSEYEEFFNRKYSDKKAEQIERVYKDKDKEKFKNEIAPIEVLHEVFTAFIKESTLSDEHKKHLLEEREFSEEKIVADGYFTFPTKRIMKSFLQRLKDDYGYNESILKDVPGFYYDKINKSWIFSKNKGIGMPMPNANGLIEGIQIRRDSVDEGKSRYIWFSSAFVEYDDKLSEKFEHGTSSGSPTAVAYPEKIKNKTIFITEGWFKAVKIAEMFGSVTISVQGVGSWRNISKEIKAIQKRVGVEFKNIFVAYDADMAYNVQVFRQAMKMTNNLKAEFGQRDVLDKSGKPVIIESKIEDENGEEVICKEVLKEDVYNIYYVMWDVEYGKGIDDLISLGHKDMLEYKVKEEFDAIYCDFIKDVISKYEKGYNTKLCYKYSNVTKTTTFYDGVINDIIRDIAKHKVEKEVLKEHFEVDVMTDKNFPKIAKYVQDLTNVKLCC